MVYKPNFCCNCGEKIKRAEWKILTSRRFCDVCAVEQQGHEYLLRALVVGSLLIGVFGFGSYLRSPGQPRVELTRDAINGPPSTSIVNLKPQPVSKESERVGTRVAGQTEPGASLEESPPGPAGEATKEQLRANGFASDKPVYYCGAMTKKGKPCSRRVKSKGRCWQHAGQPSAVAPSAADVY